MLGYYRLSFRDVILNVDWRAFVRLRIQSRYRSSRFQFQNVAIIWCCNVMLERQWLTDFEVVLFTEEASLFKARAGVPSFARLANTFEEDVYVSPKELGMLYGGDGDGEVYNFSDVFNGLIAEIKSGKSLAVDELCALRRQLALVYHPDRWPLEIREEATLRMSRINDVIDQAVRSAKAATR